MMREYKKKRRNLIISIVVAVVLLLLIVVMSVHITEITVTGNRQYTSEQIVSILFSDSLEKNSVYCFLKDRFVTHQQIPFVEDYKISFISPGKVEVILYEKSVVGYVSYMGSCMYFDKDGIIVESSSTRLEGIPWINGLKFGQVVLYQPLGIENPAIFEQILNLTQILSTYEIKVDEIKYDTYGSAVLVIGDIDVVLGDNSQMNGKIAELNQMMPVMTGLSGTLYLDTYNETDSGTTYRFVKRK